MGKVRNILRSKNNLCIFVCPNSTVFEALELMFEKNVGALLVLDHQEELVGIFTERDYARKGILRGNLSRETPVREIMTEDPVTVTLDNTIEDCMQLMTHKYLRHLPVIDNGKLVGIISIGDVVKYIIEEQRYIIENLEHYISGT